MRYFEDLVVGEESESGTLVVSEPELIEFAKKYDPQYFHTDPKAAAGHMFGGVVASGIYTMALWRQLDHQIAHDIAWICGVRWDDVIFAAPVRPGDTLRARSRCLSKRPSDKKPERGVTVHQYTLLNQRDETVFSCRSVALIQRSAHAAEFAG